MDTIVKFVVNTKPTKNFQAKVMHPTFVNPVLRVVDSPAKIGGAFAFLVRAMEEKGIRTEKGEFNRWIKATNAVIRDIKKKIALLFDWIAEAKVELAKPQAPDLVSLLNAYYTQRRAGAYSQKGKISNLKEMNETFNYLRKNGIYSLEDLESRVSEHSAATESLKKTLIERNHIAWHG